MNKIYLIRTKEGDEVRSVRNNNWCYKTLGAAKVAAKNIISYRNKRRQKPDRIKYEDFVIVEFDLIESDTHPI